jgi:hypothetical protein
MEFDLSPFKESQTHLVDLHVVSGYLEHKHLFGAQILEFEVNSQSFVAVKMLKGRSKK